MDLATAKRIVAEADKKFARPTKAEERRYEKAMEVIWAAIDR